MIGMLAFLIKNPPPPIGADEAAWFDRINWNGLILLVCMLLVLFVWARRIARRFRRREKESLEMATWANAGYHFTSRIFRKYGRSMKQNRLSRIAVRLVEGRINRHHSKYDDDFEHFRTKKLSEMEQNDEKR